MRNRHSFAPPLTRSLAPSAETQMNGRCDGTCMSSARARATRIRQPPDRSLVFFLRNACRGAEEGEARDVSNQVAQVFP